MLRISACLHQDEELGNQCGGGGEGGNTREAWVLDLLRWRGGLGRRRRGGRRRKTPRSDSEIASIRHPPPWHKVAEVILVRGVNRAIKTPIHLGALSRKNPLCLGAESTTRCLFPSSSMLIAVLVY